tara:strand:- start:1513 stop:1902 length:390 start_codon:yes stop_codon:yes gene_type:complete
LGWLSRDADFENVSPLVLGNEIWKGEEIARVSRHAGPFDGIDFDWGVGVGLFEVRSFPPKWAGDDIGFSIGIDITNRCAFGDILIEELDFLKLDVRLGGLLRLGEVAETEQCDDGGFHDFLYELRDRLS